jgi:hypothetical protein
MGFNRNYQAYFPYFYLRRSAMNLKVVISACVLAFTGLELILYYPDYLDIRFIVNMVVAWVAGVIAWLRAK